MQKLVYLRQWHLVKPCPWIKNWLWINIRKIVCEPGEVGDADVPSREPVVGLGHSIRLLQKSRRIKDPSLSDINFHKIHKRNQNFRNKKLNCWFLFEFFFVFSVTVERFDVICYVSMELSTWHSDHRHLMCLSLDICGSVSPSAIMMILQSLWQFSSPNFMNKLYHF